MKKATFFLFVTLISSCYKSINQTVVNDFITKYRDEKFLEFKNVFIFIRSSGFTNSIYFLGKFEGNEPLYFVTYNEVTGTITEISRQQLNGSKVDDYFTKSQITFLVEKFRQTHFCLLGVDSHRNILFNPFYPNNPAFFLHLSSESNIGMFKMMGDYKLYKDNWYINKRAVKPDMHLTGF
jgi:hypothetical protein